MDTAQKQAKRENDRIRMREWRAANPEKAKSQAKRHRDTATPEQKEAQSERMREWRLANKTIIQAYQKEWREKNVTHIASYQQKYHGIGNLKDSPDVLFLAAIYLIDQGHYGDNPIGNEVYNLLKEYRNEQ